MKKEAHFIPDEKHHQTETSGIRKPGVPKLIKRKEDAAREKKASDVGSKHENSSATIHNTEP